MLRNAEDKGMELAKDLAIKIAWDSFEAKKIKLDQEGLIDRLLSHGIYIFALEDILMVQFRQGTEIGVVMKALIGVVGKSITDVVIKMIRKREYDYKEIIISNVIGEAIGFAWDTVMLMDKPSNGIAGIRSSL